MGGPGTHHCSPEGNEPDPIWCQGHGLPVVPLQMGQGHGGTFCLWGHSLLKWPSCPQKNQVCELGPVPEEVTHVAAISAS
jgi:hypothetical protein